MPAQTLFQLPIAERVELSRPRWVRSRAPGDLSKILALLGAISFSVAFTLDLNAPWLSLFACPFRAMTSLPCLGCGATHAFVHLAHGNVLAALRANPLWTLVAAGLWMLAIFVAARLAGLRWTLALPTLSPRNLRRARLSLFALAAANWAFVALQS